MAQTHIPEFPMAEAKKIVQELFKPNPVLYWVDFLTSDLLGWVAFVTAVRAPFLSLVQVLAWMVTGLSLYRAILFVHELAHLKKGTFKLFHAVWNLLCGIPLMIPSFIYIRVHTDHHKHKVYGTRFDPEYFPFALAKPYRIPLFPLTMFLAPLFFLIRFLVLAPLSYLIWSMRKPLWVLGSSLAVGGDYRRPLPQGREKWEGMVQEFLAFLFVTGIFTLMTRGILPWRTLLIWYGMAVTVLILNALRSLVAHCDRNPPDHIMSFDEQFLDSTNIPGNQVLTPLWAPVGLRYHATHHLFSGMPYHHLAEAHRRLMKELPAGNPYPLSIRKGLLSALTLLWEESRRNNQKGTRQKTVA